MTATKLEALRDSWAGRLTRSADHKARQSAADTSLHAGWRKTATAIAVRRKSRAG